MSSADDILKSIRNQHENPRKSKGSGSEGRMTLEEIASLFKPGGDYDQWCEEQAKLEDKDDGTT